VVEMYRTDDPHADFDRWDAEQEARLEKLPVCVYCGERVQTKRALYINDDFMCMDCVEEHTVDVEEYLDD
jgi:formylmethanofuran dehydrogenase subunit E